MSISTETINCTFCNTPNYSTATKCGRCGKPLPNKAENLEPAKASYLVNCPDCNNPVSAKAENCPICGRFFQSLSYVKIDRRGWIGTIAGGIILGYFGIILVSIVLWIFLMMFFASVFTGLGR